MEEKIIHDPVHGSLKLDALCLSLLSTTEVQRLSQIKQLGMAYLVFPGANHTRLEHSLGACHLAHLIGKELGLPQEDVNTVKAAALLHDIGHLPFSHVFESVVHRHTGKSHVDIGAEIVRGRYCGESGGNIPTILAEHGVEAEVVARLLKGGGQQTTLYDFPYPPAEASDNEKPHLAQIIHGCVDVDQMDYLVRDAHYTGVAHGSIDLERLILTLRMHKGRIAVDVKGVSAVEGMLVARSLMYSAVYLHKTVCIAGLMLSNAVEQEGTDFFEMWRMNDCALLSLLKNGNKYQQDIYQRLMGRRLFKAAIMKKREELNEEQRKALIDLAKPERRREVEASIADRAGVPEGYVLINIPLPELLFSEPRIFKTEIPILEGAEVKSLLSVSPLARALLSRSVSKWVMMVVCPEKHRERVREIGEKVLFG